MPNLKIKITLVKIQMEEQRINSDDVKKKILMTSVGIEPTTSGLDLPLLCRLSYEVGQRKSGTIKVVNRGEEKVRVHLNVVPCSTMNTNGGTENQL